MASIRQGYLDDYSQNVDKVGIGTSISQEKLQVVGDVMSTGLSATGIATLTSASGFIERNLEYVENVDIDAGDSATLSGEIIVGAGLTMTVGTGATAGQGNIDSLKVYSMFQPPTGGTNQRPVGKPGSLFYNTDFKTVEFFDGNSWRQVDNTTRRGRALFAGGQDPSVISEIDEIDLTSQGNGTAFGSLSVARRTPGACSSEIRGIFGGGSTPSNSDVIDYVTIASSGTAIDFGNLTASTDQVAACSSSTRGLFGGGEAPSNVNTISYIEINTLGNSLDFGDLTETKRGHSGMASATRGFFSGGNNPSNSSIIDVVNISSRGNTVIFGNDITNAPGTSSSSNSQKGILYSFGGSTHKDISSITLASDGNAIYFGDLSIGATRMSATGSQLRSVILLGEISPFAPTFVNTVEFVLYSSSGNSADFGDLSRKGKSRGALSDSHGGLGGF
tara:strand:- start:1571 stop:2911 length:1341 start_codon:yes stop_codon:yes gene_type:complete